MGADLICHGDNSVLKSCAASSRTISVSIARLNSSHSYMEVMMGVLKSCRIFSVAM